MENKIIQQINRLNPLLNLRQKRSLIDGLGTIIKSITGNLDANDAQKYDNAISQLSSNQNEIKILVKEQVTLLQKSIDNFDNHTRTLKHNQLVLESRILQIENEMKKFEIEKMNKHYYYLTHIVSSQIMMSYQIIYNSLEKLEMAITFSKLNILHNSMIDPIELLNEIKKIVKYLDQNKLPFEPTLENIVILEEIIEIKAFSKGNKLIFMLNVPIVENKYYNYYHLYTLPVMYKNNFSAVLPYSKYLLLDDTSYVFSNVKCKNIINNFLCAEITPVKIKNIEPCEIKILQYSQNLSTCEMIPVLINDIKIQKLEKNFWLIITKDQIIVNQKCKNEINKIPLKGTFLLELDINCEIEIGNVKLKNFKEYDEIYENIVVPKLYIDEIKINYTTRNIKPIELKNINLDETVKIKHALEIQKTNLNNIKTLSSFHSEISIWTVLLYALLLIAFLCILYKIYKQKFKKIQIVQKPLENPGFPL